MRAKDGDFVKLTDINGNIDYGKFYYGAQEREVDIILLKSHDIFDKDIPRQIKLKYNENGIAFDAEEMRIIIDEVEDRLLKEELRQIYNMYAG